MFRRALIIVIVFVGGLIVVGQAQAEVELSGTSSAVTLSLSGESGTSDAVTVSGTSTDLTISGVTLVDPGIGPSCPGTGIDQVTCTGPGVDVTSVMVTGTGSAETQQVAFQGLQLGTAAAPGTAQVDLGDGSDTLTVSGAIDANVLYGTSPGDGTSNTVDFTGVTGAIPDPVTIDTAGDADVSFANDTLGPDADLSITTGESTAETVDLDGLQDPDSAPITIQSDDAVQGTLGSGTTGGTVECDNAMIGPAADVQITGPAWTTVDMQSTVVQAPTTVPLGTAGVSVNAGAGSDQVELDDTVFGTPLSVTTDDSSAETSTVNLTGASFDSTAAISTGDGADTVELSTTQAGVSVDMPGAGPNTLDLSSDTQSDDFSYNATGTEITAGQGATFSGVDVFDTTQGSADTVSTTTVSASQQINAEGAAATINYAGDTDALEINLADDEVTQGSVTEPITGFPNAVGGSGGTTIDAGAVCAGTCDLAGGVGSDNTISFQDGFTATADTVDIDLPDGTATATTPSGSESYSLTDFQNATGGAGTNTMFPLLTTAGTFIGNPGTINTIDYDDPTQAGDGDVPAINMDFATGQATIETGQGTSGYVDTLTDIQSFIGGAGDDQVKTDASGVDGIVMGSGSDNSISFAADPTGTTFDFASDTTLEVLGQTIPNVEAVTGTGGNDTFDAIDTTDALDGGGGGDNTLSYAGDTSSVNVNLATGTATTSAGTTSISNFQAVQGGDGNDTLTAGAGTETLADGDGNDILTGGSGTDTLTAGNGNDTLTAGSGNDTLTAGNGNDTLTAGAGYDVLSVGSGSDNLIGAGGTGEIIAGSGVDAINPNSGAYFINASASDDDVIDAGTGANTIVGAGEDTVSFQGQSADVTIDLTGAADSGAANQAESISGVNNAIGGSGQSTFIANSQNDILQGQSGTNIFEPGTGDDTLEGGTGANTVSFATTPASDSVTVNFNTNTATDGNATDRLIAINAAILGPGPGTLIGGSGAETLEGGSGNDTITGGSGTDTITTGNGDNTIQAGSGSDTITTGNGDNTIDVRNGVPDTVTCGTGTDTVLAASIDTISNCSDVVLPAPTLGGNPAPPAPAPPTTTTTATTPAPVYEPVSATLTSRFTVIKTAPKAPKPKKGKTTVKPLDTKGYTRVSKLELKTVGADTTIVATCRDAKAKNCPFKRTTETVADQQAVYELSGLFGDVPVTPGVSFELELSQPNAISRDYTFTFVKGKQPKETLQCQTPGQEVGACAAG